MGLYQLLEETYIEMRKVSTGKYNCMKVTLPLLIIFHFSSPGGRKKMPRRNVDVAYTGSVQGKNLEFTSILLRLFIH